MINPLTLLGAGLCLGALYLRYKSQPPEAHRRSPKQISKTAKILLAAILAWMTAGYALQHLIGNIDGQHNQEPSTMERAVQLISKYL